MNRFLRYTSKWFILMTMLMFFIMSCTKDNIDDTNAEGSKREWIVSKIDEVSLNGWNNGYVINDSIYFCEFVDTTTYEIIGMIGSFNYMDNIVITCKEGYVQTVYTDTETYNFIYDETGIKVIFINDSGAIEELLETEFPSVNSRITTRTDNNSISWLVQVQNFLNNYADKLSSSDSRFLREQAEDIRNFPENLIKDGLVDGLTKLTGKRSLPYIMDILDNLGEYDRERSMFGNCMMTVLGVSKSDTDYFINANLSGFESIPSYGDNTQSVTGGIVCRYTKGTDTWNKPTTSYYDYKWEHNYKENSNLTEKLPKMNLGWYEFRSYVTRAGVTKYGNSYSYLYSVLDENPTFTISNVKCSYLGNDKFKVEFDCSFVPLNNDGLLYQGIMLNTEYGDKLTSFGAGTTTEKVSKTVSADNFTISETTATLNIKAQYWYVTRYSSETFYKDLENNVLIKYDEQPSIKFTSSQINGTSILEYDENNGNHYETTYSFKYDATGTFWIDHIQYTIVQGNWNNYWDSQTLNGDGEYSASGTATYWTSSTASHQSYYTIYLRTGGMIQSSNSLYFSGNPISSVSIIGGSRTPLINTKKTEVRELINDNRFINSYKK